MSPPTFRARRPVALLVLAALELLEALVLVGVAAVLIASGPGSRYPATAYGAGGTVLVLAALLIGVGIGVLRSAPWTRTASLVWHVVQILVGLYALTGAGPVIGLAAAVILPGVAVLVLLFVPSVSEALRRR